MLCLGGVLRRWCSGRWRIWLWCRAAWCARGWRPARGVARGAGLLGVPVGGGPPARLGDLTSFGAAPRSPARPCRRPPALQPGLPVPPVPSRPAALVSLGLARPGPAAAHRHRGPAFRSLRCPPDRRRLRCFVWWYVDSLSARLRRRPPAPQPGLPVPPVPSRPAVPSLLCVASSCPPLNNFACNCPPAKC